MGELEDDVRQARRKRMLSRGGPAEYQDAALYADVDQVLRRAVESRDRDALLVPELLSSDDDWQLATHVRFTSHRPLIGRLLVFVKRRVMLPVHRWLFEYSRENFSRQQRVNEILFACVEELAIENARLRQRAVQPESAGRVEKPGTEEL
jgi:hypothetical protein